MDNIRYIKIETLCQHYQVETILLNQLKEAGVIEICTYESCPCIVEDDVPKLEKIFRLHQDLELNVSAIEVVLNLLHKIDSQQDDIRQLKNKLGRFESSL